jgi:hypothetical protein
MECGMTVGSGTEWTVLPCLKVPLVGADVCLTVGDDSFPSRLEVAVAVLLAVDFLFGTVLVGFFDVFAATATAALSFERV